MKTSSQFKKVQGSALILVCMGAAVIIGLPLTYYLTTVQRENTIVARSQAWNSAMVTAEAGIEEGMSLVNKYAGTGSSLSSWPTTAVGADGWSALGANAYKLTRHLANASYTVIVTNVSSTAVTIKSTGTVSAPDISGITLSRAVLVAASGSSSFQGAILAKNGITLSGSAYIDSFNSQSSIYSSNGLYSFSRHEAHGNIMADSSNVVMTTEFTMSGGSHVYGHVIFGPDSTIQYSGSATIGDTNWATGNGIESGWTNNTANIYVPDAPPVPSVTWQSLPAEVKINNINTYVLPGGGQGQTNYYKASSNFNLSGSDQILATNGTVVLYGPGQFQMSGSSALQIATNASVVAWFNGQTQISGSGVVNQSGNATSFTFYGTPNCTQLQYSGSSEFIGTIYAPEAVTQWSGSSDVVGSVVVYSLANSGSSNFHYDESLSGQSSGSYVVSSWAEVSP